MDVTVLTAKHAGFCNGVRRAIDLALHTVENADGTEVYSLGELIHNGEAIRVLESKGIHAVGSLREVKSGIVLLRSHGEPPETYREAERLGLRVIDCTCPSVKHLHEKVHAHSSKGLPVILTGDPGHPEVLGTCGWCENSACYVISTEEQANELPDLKNALLVSQTTFSAAKWDRLSGLLQKRFPDITVCRTICGATAERQREAEELARKCDVMIVVGGRQSANTNKLFELCRMHCPECYLVESAGELPEHFEYIHKKIIGITAGASTPDWSLKEVFAHMDDMNEKMELTMDDVEKSMVRIHNGQTVTGTVVTITDDEVFVNIGYKADGIIKREDLVDQDVKVDDEIEVEVVKVNDGEGNVLLSQRNIINRKVWEDLMAKYQAGEYIDAVGKEAVKGGLIATVEGVRCFVPASRLSQRYVEKIDQFVGKDLKLKIIDVDDKKKRIVASRKDVLIEESAAKKAAAWDKLEEGAVVTGIVRRFADFGAFVDLGGVDGLIHITDMAWHRVNHPSEVLTVGQEVEVKILSLDKERERIQLGYKQLQAKPWDNIEDKYPVGTILERKVVRIAPFGAFVSLEPGVDGLVHISQCALTRVNKVEDALTVGQDVLVKVLAVDAEAKRITLSVREALADQSSPDEEMIEEIPGEEVEDTPVEE